MVGDFRPSQRSVPPLHFHQVQSAIQFDGTVNFLDYPGALGADDEGLTHENARGLEEPVEHAFDRHAPAVGVLLAKEPEQVVPDLLKRLALGVPDLDSCLRGLPRDILSPITVPPSRCHSPGEVSPMAGRSLLACGQRPLARA